MAEQEFGNLDLGDQRREKRLRQVMRRLMDAPMKSIKSACRGWAETMAAYRLLNNPAVTVEAILKPHRQALLERAKEQRCVAVIQDTTELDYTSKKSLQGVGPLNHEDRRGLLMHTQYVVSGDRLPLGVWHSHIFARQDEDFRAKRKHYPIEEKESFRWLEGYRKACELAAQLPDVECFSISDREGDIFEVFEQWHQLREQEKTAADWIIRANQDRALLPLTDGQSMAADETGVGHLFEQAKAAEELGTIEFEIKAREQFRKIKGGSRVKTQRAKRRVRQSIKACQVSPRPPQRRGKKLDRVHIWVVLAEEIGPPKDQEPVRWLLLTSKAIGSFEDAQRILNLYLTRWEIENFHRVLKTGCQVEEIQLKSWDAVLPCLALYQVVAWRILHLMHLGRQCPELPCGVIFEEAEWISALAIGRGQQVVGVRPAEPTLGEMVQIVGEFGGHLGRKGDPPPGAQALWQGMSRLRDFALAWKMFRKNTPD